MAVPDTDGEYISVDAAYAEQYGYDDPSALVGQDWRPLYDEQETGRTGREAMTPLHEEGEWRGYAVGEGGDGTISN